jgi:heme/copper-type cytochrome/quinol oxidase subunit 1
MHYLGVAGMPRRIPDYPDAYFIFNWISSCGALVSLISLIVFFSLIIDAFINNKKNS